MRVHGGAKQVILQDLPVETLLQLVDKLRNIVKHPLRSDGMSEDYTDYRIQPEFLGLKEIVLTQGQLSNLRGSAYR